MLKNILKLDGAQQLSKNEQKTIKGGRKACIYGQPNSGCGSNECCVNKYCTSQPGLCIEL